MKDLPKQDHYYLKKSALGYTLSDTPSDYVMLTHEQYQNLLSELASAYKAVRDEKDNLSQLERKAKDKYSDLRYGYNSRLNDADKRLKDLNEKYETEVALNANLLRICRERANADRNLRPKKKHSGYILKQTMQAQKAVYDAYGRSDIIVWRTTIESPYSVKMPASDVQRLIDRDITVGHVLTLSVKDPEYRLTKDMRSTYWSFQMETEEEVDVAPLN